MLTALKGIKQIAGPLGQGWRGHESFEGVHATNARRLAASGN